MQIRKTFLKYVSQNILGMLGISLYILADTFFISLSVGADGITALNLVLPVYSLIYAMGAMIGVGGAIRFAIANVFNSEKNPVLTEYAVSGLRIYFAGFLFAGINIVGTAILSAVESAKWAFVASLMRGFVVILCCAFTLAVLFGMTGVWLAFPVAELLTMFVTLFGLKEACRIVPKK